MNYLPICFKVTSQLAFGYLFELFAAAATVALSGLAETVTLTG